MKNPTDPTAPKASPAEEPATQPAATPREAAQKPRTLTIEITRYASLLSIVSEWRNIGRFSVFIALLLTIFFAGLTIITLSIKRFYPYNDIRTNALGAMTIKSEDKDVTYWLFNTAELWADSGIQVEEGDILTIRASGSSHTAVHHLTAETKENRALSNPWSGTQGDLNTRDKRDKLRAQWRIVPNRPSDALIMRVVPQASSLYDANGQPVDAEVLPTGEHLADVYFIGKERTDLRIAQSGTLHFAVNDIVLTPQTIYNMVRDNLLEMDAAGQHGAKRFFDSFKTADRGIVGKEDVKALFATLEADPALKALYKRQNRSYYGFGKHPGKPEEGANSIGSNELSYYNEKSYLEAWFDDNLGSFLIVVERKKEGGAR